MRSAKKEPGGIGALTIFLRDRDAAFLSMDKQTILSYCRKYGIGVFSAFKEEKVFWLAVHKARTAVDSLPMFERAASKRWLEVHGSVGINDLSINPPTEKEEYRKYLARCEDFQCPVSPQ